MTTRYLTSRHLRKRFGDCSQMWIWRRQQTDPTFPKPDLVIGNRRLWAEEKIEAWEESRKEEVTHAEVT